MVYFCTTNLKLTIWFTWTNYVEFFFQFFLSFYFAVSKLEQKERFVENSGPRVGSDILTFFMFVIAGLIQLENG